MGANASSRGGRKSAAAKAVASPPLNKASRKSAAKAASSTPPANSGSRRASTPKSAAATKKSTKTVPGGKRVSTTTTRTKEVGPDGDDFFGDCGGFADFASRTGSSNFFSL